MGEKFKYTDDVLASADSWLIKKKGTLREFCEIFGFSYGGLNVIRHKRRSGKLTGERIRRNFAWKKEESKVLRMIRAGQSVADMALEYGVKITTMHERLRSMGLTPDIRAEMARGEWDEEAQS